MVHLLRTALRCTERTLAVAAFICVAIASHANSVVPQVSNFQGLATNAAGVRLPNGTITLNMRYYSASSAGTLFYAEQFLNVPVLNGLFNVAMGSGTPLGGGTVTTFADVIRSYTQVFAEAAINADRPMAPRVQIVSAPYAIRSQTSDALGSLAASQYLDTTATAQTKNGPLSLSGSTAAGYPLLNVQQAGAGYGITASGEIGIAAFSVTGGGGVFGRSSGPAHVDSYGVSGINDAQFGVGVRGSVYGNGASTGNTAIGVDGKVGYPYLDHTFSLAAGVRGQSSVGDGVQGASTTHSGVYGFSNTNGVYGEAVLNAAVYNGTHWGVYGVANSSIGVGAGGDSASGIGMMGRSNTSYGVIGRSESGVAVRGQSQSGSGPGTGVEGDAGSGIGVRGNANAAGGTGVMASGHGAGTTALLVDNGPIKVSGTTPTAFVAIAPVYASTTWFYIDNPLTNNDPNAMLFVSPNATPDGRAEVVYNPHPVTVYYVTSANKWSITNADGAGMPTHAAFNVLVIKK